MAQVIKKGLFLTSEGATYLRHNAIDVGTSLEASLSPTRTEIQETEIAIFRISDMFDSRARSLVAWLV